MFSIWTNPEFVTASHQVGVIGADLPINEWKGDNLVFIRDDGTAIMF